MTMDIKFEITDWNLVANKGFPKGDDAMSCILVVYKKRINRVLDMARFMESDVIVLGAFGCGAFANPPELVAKAMHEAIDEHIYDFEVIEMAVYCSTRDTSNYDVFLNEFCI